MIETSPTASLKESSQAPKDEEPRQTKTPFAVRAACFALVVIAMALGSSIYKQNAVIDDMRSQLAQAGSDADKVKADLGNANARASDLQARLTKARSVQSDLQSQLSKLQDVQAALQAQVQKARSDLRAQQDGARTQAAGLQSQIGQATDEASGLRRELDQAKGQTDDLKARLATAESEVARLQPLAERAQVLPVAATFEKAFFGGSMTMHLKNLSAGPVKVKITVNGSDKAPSRAAAIDAGGNLDVEDLPEGASVVISSDGFSSSTVVAREAKQ